MIGVALLLVSGLVYEVWAEATHHETITLGVRSLPWPGRALVIALLVGLAVHFALSSDPLDRAEHELHQWLDEQKGSHP